MDKSTKHLIGILFIGALLALAAPLFPAVESRAANPLLHDLYKSFHVFGAVIFLGNIIITGIWMFLAEKSKNVEVIKFAVKAVNWADVFFTAPGVALVTFSGLVQAPHHGGLMTQSWITAGLALFSISGIVWLFLLIPYQNRLILLSEKRPTLPNQFFVTLHRWYFWGIIATVLPLLTLVLMIYQPKLW